MGSDWIDFLLGEYDASTSRAIEITHIAWERHDR